MHANNETGSVQPIGEIGALTRARGIPLHVDAVQSFGKIPFSVDEWNADLLSLSAHKINGPKGVGVLYIREGAEIEAQSYGGGHEREMRAGTENVAGIVGFGRAAEMRLDEGGRLEEEVGALRQRLEQRIVDALEDVKVNGHSQRRLGNTLNVSFQGVEAEAVVLGLDLKGIAVGSGSACSSGTTEPSHVLLAMGLEPRLAAGAVRFSLGWGNTAVEVDSVLDVLPGIVGRLREMSVF
jgi:cysteine desulfurase